MAQFRPARPGSTSKSRPARKRSWSSDIGLNVPTQEELAEIEPSSRLFERNGALYMTLSALRGVKEGEPTTTPIGFVLAGNRLVTVRYADPQAVARFRRTCPPRARAGAATR